MKRGAIIIFFIIFSRTANANSFLQNISNGFLPAFNLNLLNTENDDFAPFIDGDTLIFNSLVNGFSQYRTAKFTRDFIFSEISKLNSTINENKKNRSYFTRIDDKTAIISAFSMYPQGSFLNIQKSLFIRNGWSAPTKIPEFSFPKFSSHPTFSARRQMLVFSANWNNNDNTTDLWTATLQPDGSWNMIVPLDELNSSGNEITPYFADDNTILFASDGFDGEGGFDIYYSFYDNGHWTKPLPLDGINTDANESDPAAIEDGSIIFASDRVGGKGGLDLYLAISRKEIAPLIRPSERANKSFVVINTTTNRLDITRKIENELYCGHCECEFKDTFVVMPQLLEVSINKIQPTICKLLLNNKQIDSAVIDSMIIIDFAKYAKELYYADSLVLRIEDSELVIELNKSETRKIKKHKSKQGEYYEACMVVFKLPKESNELFYEDVLSEGSYSIFEEFNNEIADFLTNAKKIEFVLPNKYTLSSFVFDKLKQMYNIKIPLSQSNFNCDTFCPYIYLRIYI